MTLLLSLIGEQPAPNYLPIRFLHPDRNILVYTKTSEKVARRIRGIISGQSDLSNDLFTEDPYNLTMIREALYQIVKSENDVTFNLTGGTKIMSLAAYEIARQCNHKCCYLQSEGKLNILHTYLPENGRFVEGKFEILPSLITIDDYLCIHGVKPKAEKGPQNGQEAGLRRWFEKQVDECRSNMVFDGFEVDFILRRGNQVALVEAKDTKENKRKCIDQLNTAGGREYLGIYTGKVLLVKKPLGKQLSELAEARQIKLLSISGDFDRRTGRLLLSEKSKAELEIILESVLGPRLS